MYRHKDSDFWCYICKRPIIDDGKWICDNVLCFYCIKGAPTSLFENASLLEEYFRDNQPPFSDEKFMPLEKNGDAALQAWLDNWAQAFKNSKEEKRKMKEKMREFAETHLQTRGFTPHQSYMLVQRLGRRARYMSNKKIICKLIAKIE